MPHRALWVGSLWSVVLIAGCVGPTPPDAADLGMIAWEREGGWKALYVGTVATFWIGEDLFDPASAEPWNITWDLGDGNHSVGNPVRHTFTTEGRYDITARYEGREATQNVFVDLRLEEEVLAPLRHPVTAPDGAPGGWSYQVRPGNIGTTVQVALAGAAPDALHKAYAELEHPDGTIDGPREVKDPGVTWSVGPYEGAPAGTYTVRYWTEGPTTEQTLRLEAIVGF